jgi:hypothetical protein
MTVRISGNVKLTKCPHCSDDFKSLYDAVDFAMTFAELQADLTGLGYSYTGAGSNRLSVSLNCSALAMLRWQPNSGIIESWTC